jgi:hypothetical protein
MPSPGIPESESLRSRATFKSVRIAAKRQRALLWGLQLSA